jgi:hypothetical protein
VHPRTLNSEYHEGTRTAAVPLGAEGGLWQRDEGAERVERVGGHADGLARREGPAGARVKGGLGGRRCTLDGNGVAEDLREHVRRRLRRRSGRGGGGGKLLCEAAYGVLGLLEEVGALLGRGDAAGEEAHGRRAVRGNWSNGWCAVRFGVCSLLN